MMNHQELKKSVQNLIGRSETEKAIELLSSQAPKEIERELLILNSRYKRIKEELTLGIISREETERGINQIHVGLLNTLDEIDSNDGYDSTLTKSKQRNWNPNKTWAVILIPILGLMIYWSVNQYSSNKSVASPSPPADAAMKTENNTAETKAEKMVFENGGLKDLLLVEVEIKGDELEGLLTRVVGYDDNNKEIFPFKSNTPFKENKRVCMNFTDKQPDFIARAPTADGSHCWLIGKTIDGRYGLVIPSHGRDYRYDGLFDMDGNPVIQYSNYDMFLELKKQN